MVAEKNELQKDGRTGGRTDGQTDGEALFYRTPFGKTGGAIKAKVI